MVILLMAGVYFVSNFGSMSDKSVVYSDIVEHFKNQEVTEYKLSILSGEMIIKLKNNQEIKYDVPNPQWIREDLKPYIEEYNKNNPAMKHNVVRGSDNSWIYGLLNLILPMLILAVPLIYIFRKYIKLFVYVINDRFNHLNGFSILSDYIINLFS